LKLDTIVVLHTMSKPTDFGFKRSMVRVRARARVRDKVRVGDSAPICISRECTFLLVVTNSAKEVIFSSALVTYLLTYLPCLFVN